MTPRAITGLGVACAFGTGAEAFFAGMNAGPRPLSERPRPTVTSFDASKYASLATAPAIVEVPEFDPTRYLGDKGLRTLDRMTKLLVVAARLSLQDAGLKCDGQWSALSPERVGVCCSNAYGSLEAITELDRVLVLEDARYINPAKFPNTVSNSASGYVSIWEDLRALNVSVSDGNCGALDAMACADLLLSTGRAESILTGGGEAMSEALFLAFERLGALGGVFLGEAAALFALETTAGAKARGAKVLGQVTGYGTAFVGPTDDVSLLFASREATSRAIAQALADAGLEAEDIDVVASSVSGVTHFDDEEYAAIEATLGDRCVTAPKQLFGETLGAGGAMAMAASLAWMHGAPLTTVVRGTAPTKVDTVLVTSIGYYGNASAVVLRRPS